MKILLTGASGQLGHALQRSLHGLGEVIVPARAQMDLSQPDSLRQTIRAVQPDLIINPAAYTAVDKAESEPELAHSVNAIAPAIMAEEARKLGAALIHYSTDYVFDGGKRDASGALLPYDEQDPPCPLNVYGKTKLEGELAILASGCNHLILRTSWVVSMFGKNFLLTILRLANERDELKIVNDQWGAPSPAPWIAGITAQILAQLQGAPSPQEWWSKNSGLYHLTPAGCTSWCGLTEEIISQTLQLALLNKAAPKVSGIPASDYPTPARRPVNSRLNTARLEKQFGLTLPDWQSALAACLQTNYKK